MIAIKFLFTTYLLLLPAGKSDARLLSSIKNTIFSESDSSSNTISSALSGILNLLTSKTATVIQEVAEETLNIVTTQCDTVKDLLGLSYSEIDDGSEPDVNNMTLVLETRNGVITYNINDAETLIFNSTAFNKTEKVVIFIHGFIDTTTSQTSEVISNSFLSVGGYNTIVLGENSLIRWFYLRSTTYVTFIGEKLGRVLANLYNNGIPLEKLHVIGHSLGAHVAGFTGTTFFNLTGVKLPRITGLDPAGPCFLYENETRKLSSEDAEYVDVIHTNAGVFGIDEVVGDVDYWPNGGSLQPGCVLPQCQHGRSVLFFAQSVLNNTAFPAIKCQDWDSFKSNSCNDSDISYLGLASSASAAGSYYLRTGSSIPYGLGQQGLIYS